MLAWILAAGALILAVFLMIWRVWLGDMVSRRPAHRDDDGRSVPRSLTGRFAPLPADVALIAGLGKNAPPAESLNAKVLRATVGLKLVSLVLTAAAAWFAWAEHTGHLDFGPDFIGIIVCMAGLYSIGYVFRYELTYDSHAFSVPTYLFGQREYRWSDVLSLHDNGHYLYIITLDDGRRVEVQKYLVGMGDFLTFARQQIAKNDDA